MEMSLAMTTRDDSKRWPMPSSEVIKFGEALVVVVTAIGRPHWRRRPRQSNELFQLESSKIAKKQQQEEELRNRLKRNRCRQQQQQQQHSKANDAALFAEIDPSKSSSNETQPPHHRRRFRRLRRCHWFVGMAASNTGLAVICLASLLTILIGPSECQLSNGDDGGSSSSSSHSLNGDGIGKGFKQVHNSQLHSFHSNLNHQRARPIRAPASSDRQLLLLSPNGPPPIKRDKQIIQTAPATAAQTNPSSFVLNGQHQHQQQLQQQQQPSPDAPKLIPLSALDRYQEGADLRLFCSASAPKSAGRLHFEWRKNQNELLLPTNTDNSNNNNGPDRRDQAYSSDQVVDAAERGNEELDSQTLGASQSSGSGSSRRVRISMMDESASLLRVTQLEADDSGNYTCLVRNQHGFDSSTVRVNVMVKLKWIVEPPGEVRVRAGKFVQLECDASGQPAPLISWTSLKDHQTINSKVLRIDKVSTNDSGLYECRASSGGAGSVPVSGITSAQQQQRRDQNSGEQLRKIVRLIVNGK
uniref:Cell adhesion molecule-related/down-regulated by oncogenes n=1 Tax=Aceria tosichella TaxID=561515 RepID=A0A6G1SJS6_9ACAR